MRAETDRDELKRARKRPKWAGTDWDRLKLARKRPERAKKAERAEIFRAKGEFREFEGNAPQ